MNRRLFALLACLLNVAAWCSPTAAAETARSLADIEAAIGRGLSWIEEHPATPQDGGLGDLIDEAVGFSVLQRLHRTPADNALFSQALHSRLAMLEALPEFEEAIHWPHNPLCNQYHLVLSVHLMRSAGKLSAFEEEIVDQAQHALGASPDAFPTLRITVAAFLCHLGKSPAIALDALLQETLIERIAQGNPPNLLTPSPSEQAHQLSVLEVYAVVHEVVALTDFGRLPPSPWLAARREKPSLGL